MRKTLPGAEARPLFLRGNLLVEAPGWETGAALAALREAETRTVGRVVPLSVKVAIGREAEQLARLGEAALLAVSLLSGDTFRVECKRRGEHAFGSRDVQRAVGLRLEGETPGVFDFGAPAYLVHVEIFQDWAWIGCCAAGEAVHKSITRMRIHAPGERPLNRAEKKLREALAAFGLAVGPGTRALDLGAAPGGWTKALAEAGAEVLAVDPAELTPEVAALPAVTHFRGHAEELLSQPDRGPFDLLTSDMNRDPAESASAMLPLLPLLKPDGSVVMTVKFMTLRRRQHVEEALSVLGPRFQEHRERRLPHNARETTICLTRRIV